MRDLAGTSDGGSTNRKRSPRGCSRRGTALPGRLTVRLGCGDGPPSASSLLYALNIWTDLRAPAGGVFVMAGAYGKVQGKVGEKYSDALLY